ncbi:PAS domain S-box protein [Rhodopseudomonas palustris]|uniref:PAS domain S-box protein n=1 Tax=Rhodopseudomonas palustris TaxID=1076 RepID=UPI001F215548|nr:PAS domain S-box protein [Rhodopseudomonas palustris]
MTHIVIGAVVSALLSALAAYWIARANVDTTERRFDVLALNFADRVKEKLETYRYGLMAARGAVLAGGGETISFDAFHRYAEARNFSVEFPGVRGFGFVRPVAQQDVAAFVAHLRANGRPTYKVVQFAPHDGLRYLVTFFEPHNRNATAIGLDLASETNRRTAADLAAASGEATMTAPIELLPMSGMDSGVLILLPVYRAGDPVATEEQRRRALIGWTFTAVDIYSILADLHSGDGEFGFSVADDGGAPFHIVGQPRDAALSLPTSEISIVTYGRTWRIELWALPPFVDALDLPNPWFTFGMTLAIGLLLTALLDQQTSYQARRAEQNIERSRLAAIFEGSNDVIIAKTIDGTVIDWNKAAERLFGYTAEEAIGHPATELIVPKHLWDEEARILADIRDGHTVSYFRTKRNNRNGDLIDVAVSVSPIRSENGKLLGVATAARNITDLVAAEKKIRSLNASLELQVAERTAQLKKTMTLQTAILERAAYAVIVTNTDGKISLFNPAAERMLGYESSELIGIQTPALFHDLHEIAVRAAKLRANGIEPEAGFGVVGAQLAHQDPYTSVWTFIARDGTRIPVRLTLSRLRSEDGVNLGILGIAVDLTEQLKYEDELKAARESAEQAGAAKADFLANMSHEIRTPLNGIIGYADLVLEDETLAPTTRRQVERIFEASDSLRVIIDDILDFSKIEAMGVSLESKPLYLHELIDNSVSIIQPKADEKGLELRVNAPAVPAVLMGDGARLRQVLLNLLNNAVKFTTAGSVELHVACAAAAENRVRLTIAVSDTGIGISAQDQKGLFKRFSQADETISRKYGGTGLGLAISQCIVQAMGGEMSIDSEPGRGSTFGFQIELPIAAELDIERSEAPVAVGRSLRILVVDDVEMNRDLCKAMLSRAGHEVDLADSGAMAISMAAAGRCYDLILMDVQMAEIDGMEASRRIRALNSECNNVPIVALTANVLPEQVERYRAAGIDGHIGKPINRAELLAAVATWGEPGPCRRQSGPQQPGPIEPEGVVRDQAVLEELRMFAGDAEIAGFVDQLRRALGSIPPQWPPASDGAAPGDDPTQELARVAHKTVSIAGQLGFVRLADACRRLEQACLHGADVPQAFVALQAAIKEAAPEIGADAAKVA